MILKDELKLIDKVRAGGFRPEVVGCFINNKKVLFMYAREHDLWQFPQGGIKNKESIENAIKREMFEELDPAFVGDCRLNEIFYHDQIRFKNFDKTLQLDNGKPIKIIGKEYIFIRIEAPNPRINITNTQFDDHKWCNRQEALAQTEKIYQEGKRRITRGAIEKLIALSII